MALAAAIRVRHISSRISRSLHPGSLLNWAQRLAAACKNTNDERAASADDVTDGKRYEVDHGRALIDNVSLWRDGKSIPLMPLDSQERGGFVYEAGGTSRS